MPNRRRTFSWPDISANRWLKIITLLIWAGVAVLLAQLSWWLVAPNAPSDQRLQLPTISSAAGQQSSKVDTTAIANLNLFGQSQQAGNDKRRDAPKTSLNIRLVGVSASSNPARSAAIIEQAGQQQTYIVGDAIGGSNVTLEEIYADRVILDNNGRLETLQLEDIGEDRPALSLQVNKSDDAGALQKTSSLPKQQVSDALQAVQNNPQAITEFVSISPAMEQGELVGYRLNAGAQKELFFAAGFQNGDLAIAMNGYDLTNMQQAMQLSNQLSTMTQATITVLREGQPVELSIELPQSQGK